MWKLKWRDLIGKWSNNRVSLYIVKTADNASIFIAKEFTLPYLYMTWPRGMSRMSLILILSYRLKQMTYSYVLQCFEIQRITHISWTRCRIVMGYGSQCRIWYVQVDHIENSKLDIADKWLISLDHVTYLSFNHYFPIVWSLTGPWEGNIVANPVAFSTIF